MVVSPQGIPSFDEEASRTTIDLEWNHPERLMLDPTVVLLESALDWLRDQGLRDSIIVSRALSERLVGRRRQELAQFVDEPIPDEVLAAIVGLRTFSWRESQVARREVVDALLELEGGEIFADQYAYLVSHSWLALRERARNWAGDLGDVTGGALHGGLETLEAFARAGVARFNVADAQVAEYLKRARGVLPKPVVDGLKHVQGVAAGLGDPKKHPMLVVGGAAALAVLAIFPAMTVPTVAASLITTGMAVVAGDP